MSWLPWTLFGVTAVFLGMAVKYAHDLENDYEPTEEYYKSLGVYRQTLVNEVLTYLQVWLEFDEEPTLISNTFDDVSQVVLTKSNLRIELNFDWTKSKLKIVLNSYIYAAESNICKVKTFKFNNFFIEKNKIFKFIQKFKKDIDCASGKEKLSDIIYSAQQAVANPVSEESGENFTDEDFRGLLYEASIMLSDEVEAGASSNITNKSLFMIMSYIFHAHKEEYLEYIKQVEEDITEEEETEGE